MHHKWRSYDVRFLRYGAQQAEFLVTLCLFLPLYPTNNLRNKNLKKRKENLEISSFYKYVPQMTIIWYMALEIWSATDRISFHFGPLFALLPPDTQKIKILIKWKKRLEISSFYKGVPQINTIWRMVPETWSPKDRTFCHFGPFFALLPQ